MLLHRLVTARFDTPPELPGQMRAQVGPILVESSPVTFNGAQDERTLIIASIELDFGTVPMLDADGYLVVPDQARQLCEYGIEVVVNSIAVLSRTGRSISSATPFLGLSNLSEQQQQVLAECKGLRGKLGGQFRGYSTVDLTDPAVTAALLDRIVAVGLVAEAFSTNHPVGRYREYVRLIEYAFARPLAQAEKKISQFLASADLGYTRDEVREWVSKRDGTTHGDLKKTANLFIEADVRPFLGRMEQAVMDILLNKKTWHTSSSERRSAFPHHVATTDPQGRDLLMTRGLDAKLTTHVIDPFNAYPMDLNAVLTTLPESWWFPAFDTHLAQGKVRMRDP